jgi:hypothetical protein
MDKKVLKISLINFLFDLFSSGGSGNFILSTSSLGYGITGGGTPPMCLNGYGVFYRIGNDA